MNANPSLWSSDPALDIPALDLDAPAPSSARTPSRIINYEAALKRLGGRKELFGSLARFFLSDSPALIEQIHDGLQRSDCELVTRSAHSLKGLCANFDAQEAQRCAWQIEQLAAANKLGQAEQQLPEMEKLLQKLQNELRPFANVKGG